MFRARNPLHLGAAALALALAAAAIGKENAMAFTLSSAAFQEGGTIPRKHTCDGPDASPPLKWTEPPADARAFALIVDDPDAPVGTWVHWVLYNLPAGAREFSEAVPLREKLPDGSLQGTNDFRRVGYGGPCPLPGPAHRYFFRLYALDSALGFGPRASKADLLQAMKGHILGEAKLMGRYGR